jgi:hypothetical protein
MGGSLFHQNMITENGTRDVSCLGSMIFAWAECLAPAWLGFPHSFKATSAQRKA